MKVFVMESAAQVAEQAARRLAELLQARPQAVLGLPTGATPEGMYAELVRLEADFSQASTFNLDEYAGLSADHPGSYHAYMRQHLLDRLKVGEAHIPNGTAEDLDEECRAYEAAIQAAGGLDLVVLGIGHDGHIAFNEPPAPFDSRTRVVELASPTRRANAQHFPAGSEPPCRALSMGIATILEARSILLLATGSSKAGILARALTEPPNPELPASALQRHKDVTVLCDRPAAADL